VENSDHPGFQPACDDEMLRMRAAQRVTTGMMEPGDVGICRPSDRVYKTIRWSIGSQCNSLQIALEIETHHTCAVWGQCELQGLGQTGEVIHQYQLTYHLIHNYVLTVQSSDNDVSVPWMVKHSFFISSFQYSVSYNCASRASLMSLSPSANTIQQQHAPRNT